jgi:hypothetical protein
MVLMMFVVGACAIATIPAIASLRSPISTISAIKAISTRHTVLAILTVRRIWLPVLTILAFAASEMRCSHRLYIG